MKQKQIRNLPPLSLYTDEAIYDEFLERASRDKKLLEYMVDYFLELDIPFIPAEQYGAEI